MSNIRAGTISGVNGTDPVTLTKQSAAKCWVNFNGIGVAIRDSVNTSSMVDISVGHHQINFSNAMENTTYAIQSHDWGYGGGWSDTMTTSSYRTKRRHENNSYLDVEVIWGLIHGDLA